MMTPELWLQITAGKGPVECAWAVAKVLETIQVEAVNGGLQFRTLDVQEGPEPATINSALVAIGGAGSHSFASSWQGTVQWVARSPFRPEHKRKNWFVGIEVLEPLEETRFDLHDVSWETMRASGPGGQHVNRTESAVRVTHRLTGVQATASEERSQHRNRKLALARLARKLAEDEEKRQDQARERRWNSHRDLERGNPVRILRS